jgi:hypothetical protein
MILVNAIAILMAVGSYVAVIGTVLYVTAVVSVFAREPGATLWAATRSFPIGLALLTGLVGVSALLGRLLRHSVGVLKAVLRPTAIKPAIEAGPVSNDDAIDSN